MKCIRFMNMKNEQTNSTENKHHIFTLIKYKHFDSYYQNYKDHPKTVTTVRPNCEIVHVPSTIITQSPHSTRASYLDLVLNDTRYECDLIFSIKVGDD